MYNKQFTEFFGNLKQVTVWIKFHLFAKGIIVDVKTNNNSVVPVKYVQKKMRGILYLFTAAAASVKTYTWIKTRMRKLVFTYLLCSFIFHKQKKIMKKCNMFLFSSFFLLLQYQFDPINWNVNKKKYFNNIMKMNKSTLFPLFRRLNKYLPLHFPRTDKMEICVYTFRRLWWCTTRENPIQQKGLCVDSNGGATSSIFRWVNINIPLNDVISGKLTKKLTRKLRWFWILFLGCGKIGMNDH